MWLLLLRINTVFIYSRSLYVTKDPFTVSVAILVGGQSQLKLQQMYGKLFNFQTL